MNAFKTLFFDTLADAYSAEQQIMEALPKMSEMAQSPDLKEALEAHLAETEAHVQAVEQVFECFGEKPRSRRCKAAMSLLEEGDTLVDEFEGSFALDAVIISAAQKIEHYEIASYGSLHTWAGLLGNEEAVDLLAGILEEEKLADATLTELAMAQDMDEALDEEEEGESGEEEDMVRHA